MFILSRRKKARRRCFPSPALPGSGSTGHLHCKTLSRWPSGNRLPAHLKATRLQAGRQEPRPGPKSSPKKYFSPRNTRNTRTNQMFPPPASGFAYFAYFAVLSVFHIGMVFESPFFSRHPLAFAIVRRGFGPGAVLQIALKSTSRLTGITCDAMLYGMEPDNFVTHVIAERQAEARFIARQKHGNPAQGRKLLSAIRERLASRAKTWKTTQTVG